MRSRTRETNAAVLLLSFSCVFSAGAAIAVAACGGAPTKDAAVPGVSTAGPDAHGAPTSSGPGASGAKPSSDAPIHIACGDFHSCALMGDGSVRCWGRNKEGELGDGTTENRSKPTKVIGVSGAKQLALTSHASCALLADGTVTCWGGGKAWGDDKERDNVMPTPVTGIANAVEIDAGGLLVCARLKSGKVQCWGEDDTAKKSKVRPPDSGAEEVSVAEAHACARMSDGAVRCWGDGPWAGVGPASFVNPGVQGAKQISTGDSVACALLGSGAVTCWGRNEQGELGKQPPDSDYHPKAAEIPGVSGAARIVAGEAHLCAIGVDKKATCWGSNGDGELGRGVQGEPQAPGPLPLANVEEIALGADHGCARTTDGAVHCWGGNSAGQVGDGSTTARLSPTRVVW